MARPSIHGKLAEKIRLEIMSYRDGWEIPSVRSLARQYGVATNTVRRALSQLAEQNEIVLPGPSSRYVRRLSRSRRSFCKPYPAVGLLYTSYQNLTGEDYIPLLVGSFLMTLRESMVPAILLPSPENIDLELIPGGVAIRAPQCRFSAVAFLLGGAGSMLAAMVRSGAVVMAVDFLSEVEGVDSVVVDCQAEAEMAAAHLAKLRHRHIAFLAALSVFSPSHWPEGIDPDASRFGKALLQAKQRLGLNPSAEYHIRHETDLARTDGGVRAALDRLWRLSPPPTALVCFDMTTASQARRILAEQEIQCPRDISIMSRDCVRTVGSEFTRLLADPRQIGSGAAAHLLTRLSSPMGLPARLQFPSVLSDGSTTGPAPRPA